MSFVTFDRCLEFKTVSCGVVKKTNNAHLGSSAQNVYEQGRWFADANKNNQGSKAAIWVPYSSAASICITAQKQNLILKLFGKKEREKKSQTQREREGGWRLTLALTTLISNLGPSSCVAPAVIQLRRFPSAELTPVWEKRLPDVIIPSAKRRRRDSRGSAVANSHARSDGRDVSKRRMSDSPLIRLLQNQQNFSTSAISFICFFIPLFSERNAVPLFNVPS